MVEMKGQKCGYSSEIDIQKYRARAIKNQRYTEIWKYKDKEV